MTPAAIFSPMSHLARLCLCRQGGSRLRLSASKAVHPIHPHLVSYTDLMRTVELFPGALATTLLTTDKDCFLIPSFVDHQVR